jgi:hypothetical protein
VISQNYSNENVYLLLISLIGKFKAKVSVDFLLGEWDTRIENVSIDSVVGSDDKKIENKENLVLKKNYKKIKEILQKIML